MMKRKSSSSLFWINSQTYSLVLILSFLGLILKSGGFQRVTPIFYNATPILLQCNSNYFTMQLILENEEK